VCREVRATCRDSCLNCCYGIGSSLAFLPELVLTQYMFFPLLGLLNGAKRDGSPGKIGHNDEPPLMKCTPVTLATTCPAAHLRRSKVQNDTIGHVPLKLRTVHLSDNTIIYESKVSVQNVPDLKALLCQDHTQNFRSIGHSSKKIETPKVDFIH
jgi:hypothetical protein